MFTAFGHERVSHERRIFWHLQTECWLYFANASPSRFRRATNSLPGHQEVSLLCMKRRVEQSRTTASATTSGKPYRSIGIGCLQARHVLCGTSIMNISMDNARADCIYANALASDFLRQPNSHRVDCTFCRRVMYPCARCAMDGVQPNGSRVMIVPPVPPCPSSVPPDALRARE
jgi:hypothetical protein